MSSSEIRVIFIGDIVGKPGRKAVKTVLQELLADETYPTVVIGNVENSAGGFGFTRKIYDELAKAGMDIFTGGNHIWDRSGIKTSNAFEKLVVPVNLPQANGMRMVLHADIYDAPLTVINISGRVFMQQYTDNPFTTFDRIYTEGGCEGRIVIVDFHAEATSEKIAFAEYTKGRAAAVIGTHTHVQTADERMLPNGAFFISDAGSCCAVNSILGMTVESSMARFFSPKPMRMRVEERGPLQFNGVELIIDVGLMKVTAFKRINKIID